MHYCNCCFEILIPDKYSLCDECLFAANDIVHTKEYYPDLDIEIDYYIIEDYDSMSLEELINSIED